MHPVCRTCLREIADNNLLALTEDTESLRVKTELSVCIPEIVVDTVKSPVMCFKCVHALHSAYEFKTQCLQTEERINNYIENPNLTMNSDFPVENLEFSGLQYCNAAVTKTSIDVCSKPIPYDIREDLNNLLDEALQKMRTRSEIFDDKYVECAVNVCDRRVTEPQEIVESNEDQKPIIIQNNMTLKECCVVCEKLPDNVVNSKLKTTTQNIPHLKVKPNNKLQRGGRVLLKCSKCAYVTSNKAHLKVHRKIHIAEKPFQCNICNYSCAYKKIFKKHMLTHTDEPFACKVCPFRSDLKQNLETHRRIHRKPFACNTCPYKSAFKYNLFEHVRRTHGDKKNFKSFACNMCPYKSAFNQDLKRHIRRNHGDKKNVMSFACNMCPYKNAFKDNLLSHVRRAHADKTNFNSFACNMCPYKSAFKPDLIQHIRRQHRDKENVGSACNMCPYKSAFKQDLIQHIRRNHGDKINVESFACNTCPYKSAYKYHLKQHCTRCHSNEKSFKPFTCNTCPYKSAYKHNLNRHNKLIHGGEKP